MKKGISVLSLVITIIVISILGGVIGGAGLSSIEFATINRFATEILNVQAAVDKHYYKHDTYPSKQTYMLDITTINSEAQSQFNTEIVADNKITLKIVNLSLLGITDTEFGRGDETDIYVLSEATGKVYYIQGVVYEDETYHTVTNDLYAVLNIDISNDVISTRDIKVYDVIFSPSTVSYTNEPVTVKVKLPKEAIVNNITCSGEKSVSDEVLEGAYKTFTVNATSTDRTGNYTIEINYTYDETEKTAKYAVECYDDELPEVTTLIQEGGEIKIITISASDDLSGIRNIKYVEEETSDDNYIKQYGKVVNGNKITISSLSEYTIYVEDNAGNYTKITSAEDKKN